MFLFGIIKLQKILKNLGVFKTIVVIIIYDDDCIGFINKKYP